MEKANFSLNSQAILSIIGPSTSKLSIKILDSNDTIVITDSITTSSTGKSKYAVDLNGLSSGIYKASVSGSNIQDSVQFSVGLEAASGSISLIATKENYTPGESILVLGNTGSDSRITITLYDTNGKISSVTETFSDGSGNFSTNDIGIPINAELGDWKLTAHNRLDQASYQIKVSLPTDMGIILSIDSAEFTKGDIITIGGIAQSDFSRITINITDQDGILVATLETPITSDNTFSMPWTIPSTIGAGTYTITATDTVHSDSFEVFIQ